MTEVRQKPYHMPLGHVPFIRVMFCFFWVGVSLCVRVCECLFRCCWFISICVCARLCVFWCWCYIGNHSCAVFHVQEPRLLIKLKFNILPTADAKESRNLPIRSEQTFWLRTMPITNIPQITHHHANQHTISQSLQQKWNKTNEWQFLSCEYQFIKLHPLMNLNQIQMTPFNVWGKKS